MNRYERAKDTIWYIFKRPAILATVSELRSVEKTLDLQFRALNVALNTIKDYGGHLHTCARIQNLGSGADLDRCTCGYDQTLQRLNHLRNELSQ